MFKAIFAIILISVVSLSTSQECDPEVVEWFPHPNSCSRFIMCFHGNPLDRTCAPNLHFSPSIRKCTFPELAGCDINFMCPPFDDPRNPVLLPDRDDCQKYYVCFMGVPLPRTCADGLWWDVNNSWCERPEDVTCDDRTTNQPGNPITTTQLSTTVITEPPILTCHRISHLFNPNDGAYMKSYCIVNTVVGYDASEARCQELNMNLFIIDNSVVQSEFLAATNRDLATYPGGVMWINGRRENEEWFTFNPNRAPLYSGIDWIQTDTVDGRTSGDCLRLSQQHGPDYLPRGEDCGQVAYASCEFFQPPAPNRDICTLEDSLVDESGNYLKTSCIVGVARSYQDSEIMCRENGMNLFVINNSTVQTALTTSTTDLLPSNGFVWINGQRDNNGDWFTYSPTRQPIYPSLDWLDLPGTQGDCLLFIYENGRYQPTDETCVRTAWSICEY